MQRWMAVAAVAGSLLLGCSKSGVEQPPAAAPAPQPAVTPVKTLLPTFAAARECLTSCQTLWFSSKSGPAQSFVPALPVRFADLLDMLGEQARFQALVENFPPEFQPIGKLQADDTESAVNTGSFGSYKKEVPKMHGNLANVLTEGGKTIYIYSHVAYFRPASKSTGSMQVALDPETHEVAAVVRSGSELDGYYIVGANSVRGALLAFTVASDLETAAMLAHYAKNPGTTPYDDQAIVFPLGSRLAEAQGRVALLNDKLGDTGQVAGVAAPAELQAALKTQEENSWYGVAQGRSACIVSPLSPAQRIDLIKEAGVTPRTRDTLANGKLAAVEVSATDGGSESTWVFFKSKAECERTLASSQGTPDRYK